MTESRTALDIAYSVMVDPGSDLLAARHATFEGYLLAPPDSDEGRELSDEEKRSALRAGIIARGEDITERLTAGAVR